MVTADDLYAALVRAHRDLDSAASAALDARLILLLIDALDDPERVLDMIEQARLPR